MTVTCDVMLDKVLEILAKELRYDKNAISESTKISDLNLDSLAFAECIIAIERECKQRIDVVGLSEILNLNPSVFEFCQALLDKMD